MIEIRLNLPRTHIPAGSPMEQHLINALQAVAHAVTMGLPVKVETAAAPLAALPEEPEPLPHPDCTCKPACMCPACAAAEQWCRADRTRSGAVIHYCPECNTEKGWEHRQGCSRVGQPWVLWEAP